MALAIPKQLAVAVSFTTQIVVGAVLFLIILGVAAGLAWVVSLLERNHLLPTWLAGGMHYLEIMIWAIDVLFYALFLIVELIRSAQKLIREEAPE